MKGTRVETKLQSVRMVSGGGGVCGPLWTYADFTTRTSWYSEWCSHTVLVRHFHSRECAGCSTLRRCIPIKPVGRKSVVSAVTVHKQVEDSVFPLPSKQNIVFRGRHVCVCVRRGPCAWVRCKTLLKLNINVINMIRTTFFTTRTPVFLLRFFNATQRSFQFHLFPFFL